MKLFSYRGLVCSGLCLGSLLCCVQLPLQAQTSTFDSTLSAPRSENPAIANAPSKVWLSLGYNTSDERAPDWKWLRAQCENGRVLDELDAKRLAALVVPVFDDGRAFYVSKVAPFKGRNPNARKDEAALRALLVRAQAANVPVYLGIDALGWQKVDAQSQWPTAKNDGLFDRAPELQEINKDFATQPPRGTLYASPFNPKVRESMTAVVREVAQKFPTIAGIVLNVRLSREEIVGYSGAARVAAMKELHFDPLDLGLQGKADDVIDERARQWITWRQRGMTQFVQALTTAAKSKNAKSRVLVSGTADYSSQADFNALRTGQDWSSWVRSGIVDGVLLEGHWLPRYSDSTALVNTDSKLLVATSSGNALATESSYSRDWKSLHRTNSKLDLNVVARNNDDLQAVSALLRGEDVLPVAPAPQINEIAPEWTLIDSVGKRWSGRELRGQRAVAMLNIGTKASLSPDELKSLSETSEKLRSENIEPFVVSSTALPLVDGVTNLVDTTEEWLPSFSPGFSLLSIDRAGFVRALRVLDAKSTVKQAVAQIADSTPVLEEGKLAPDFVIADMNGQVRRLSDLRGKKNLLLTFFPKCFTGGCTNHLTSIQAEKAAFDANDTEVLAVSIDAADVQIAFAQRWNLTFPLVPDVGRNLSMLYGAARSVDDLAERQSILIDKNGIVRLIDRNVDIHTHGADMLKKMQALGLAK